jgi:uncharacterized protein (DUF2147 family)
MKGLYTLIVAVTLMPATIAAAQEADAILGNWLTAEGKAILEIYKCDDRYCGRIVWLKEPKNEDGTDKLDTNNPDPAKRTRTLLGLNLIWDFKHDKANRWASGKIYDPDNGKTYSCKMGLENDRLKVRGYIGVSLLGRTTVWTRTP